MKIEPRSGYYAYAHITRSTECWYGSAADYETAIYYGVVFYLYHSQRRNNTVPASVAALYTTPDKTWYNDFRFDLEEYRVQI